jgi:hypothetical protein
MKEPKTMNKNEFPPDEQISKWQGRALKLSPDCNIEQFFYPNYSAYSLKRMAITQKRRYQALMLCAKAADLREDIEDARREKEAARIKQLIRDVSKSVHFASTPDDDDDGAFRDDVLNLLVDYPALVDIDDERLKRAFQNKHLYLYLDEDHPGKRDHDFWVNAIERYCAPGA